MIPDRRRRFELWDGHKVVGYAELETPLFGTSVAISFAPPILKQVYGKQYETITCPIAYRQIADDGVDYTVRRCLDVRKKSKRQRAMLASTARQDSSDGS